MLAKVPVLTVRSSTDIFLAYQTEEDEEEDTVVDLPTEDPKKLIASWEIEDSSWPDSSDDNARAKQSGWINPL